MMNARKFFLNVVSMVASLFVQSSGSDRMPDSEGSEEVKDRAGSTGTNGACRAVVSERRSTR
jgi:hypothetical protein